jgi:predicted CoA-binding protein
MDAKNKTLVIGASENKSRYSYLAMQRLMQHDHEVVAIGKRPGKVGNITIETNKINWQDIDTITLYLNPLHQKNYYDYFLSLKPRRIIFNPGTENDELAKLAVEQGIQTVEGCTLVMLGTGQY